MRKAILIWGTMERGVGLTLVGLGVDLDVVLSEEDLAKIEETDVHVPARIPHHIISITKLDICQSTKSTHLSISFLIISSSSGSFFS